LHSAAHERGAILFVVGHDPRLVPYADRVLHLADGKLAAEPAPRPNEVSS
jgi:putative ABC transport system ATP-binding protein